MSPIGQVWLFLRRVPQLIAAFVLRQVPRGMGSLGLGRFSLPWSSPTVGMLL